MTLREKITKAVTIPFSYEEKIIQCEQIADDFAMGFAEWMVSGVEFLDDTEKGRVYLYKHNRYYTSELLQIYKTEKSANCTCKIPEPKGKCSENGIDVYCNKCGKRYNNQ